MRSLREFTTTEACLPCVQTDLAREPSKPKLPSFITPIVVILDSSQVQLSRNSYPRIETLEGLTLARP